MFACNYEKACVWNFKCSVFSNSGSCDVLNRGSIHHLPALFLHLTAETSVDFSFLYFFLFFLTFLPASVPLFQIQHLGESGGAFLRVAVCWFDLFLGCVKQTDKHTRSPPAAPPLMQFSTMWKINSECWHLPHSFGRQRQTESTVSVPPPPNQIKLPRIFQLWVNERATGLGQIVLMAAFPLIYSCVYSSLLSCPSPPTKRRKSCLVTSGVICVRHNLRLHLWTRHGFHTSAVILSLTEGVAKLRPDQSVDMFIIVLAITWLQWQLDVVLLSNNLLLFISERPNRLTR